MIFSKNFRLVLVAGCTVISSLLPVSAGLVSHFTFDDPAALGNDSGAFDNDGTVSGNAQRSTTAQIGSGSLLLDGNGDYINVGGASDYSSLDDNGDGFTLTAWVRPNSTTSVRRIFSTSKFSGSLTSGWGAGTSGSAPFATTYGQADFNSDNSIVTLGNWQHLAYVYRPAQGQVRFYRNGFLIAVESGTAGLNNTTNDFIIGGLGDPGFPQWFSGRIDDLRIYDNELSTSEISVLADPNAITPTIDTFEVSPAPLTTAGSATLSWATTDATTLTLDGGNFSNQDVTGLTSISTGVVNATTTFTLTATNSGSTTQQLTLAVTNTALDPVITEFVADNETGLTDEEGSFEDWIEIYNPNDFALNLDGWHLTDDPLDLGMWNFPDITLPRNSYLVIFASKKNLPLHADLKLKASGEYLALTRPNETIAQEFAPKFPGQTPDFSYGPDGFFVPTPGTVNGPPLTDLPPLISSVTGGETQPTEATDIIVNAIVEALAGGTIADVTLRYRVGYGSIINVPMISSGPNYTATIPSSAFNAGDMVRWYVAATSSGGSTSREPRFDDSIESPEYFGTVVTDSSITTDLPVLYWFVNNEGASETRTGTQASLFFEGQFYDNIFCRTRGQSAGSWPKHKFKFDFPKGNHFRWSSDEPRVEEFNLQSFYREMFSINANTSYMREPLMFRYMKETGVAAPDSRYLSVRRNGEFYGLFSFIEQVDEDFVRKHGYSGNGPLYKAARSSGPNPATLAQNPVPGWYRKSILEDEPFTDLEEFTDGIALSNPDRFTYVRDHVNIAQWINTIASMVVPFNHDQLTKNYYVYREPETGEWHRFPWDADQSFPVGQYITQPNWQHPLYGDQSHTQELSGGSPNPVWGNVMHTAIMDDPVLRQMYLRRVKTLADQYLADGNVSSTTLIASNDPALYLVPTDGSLDTTWFTKDFEDSSWASGAGGFGFENIAGSYDPWIGTRIKPSESGSGATSFYLRYHFTLTAEQVAEFTALTLRMRWDDGFVAYVNGVEIERNNVTAPVPSWNTTASTRSDSANTNFTDFTILANNLVAGDNVFAIQCVNRSSTNSDQLLQLELLGASLPYFEQQVEGIRALIEDDAAEDKTAWAARGVTIGTMATGVNEILNVSLPTRRNALFNTYASFFPSNQPSMPMLTFGSIEYNPASGNQEEEYIEVVNNENTAIDISNWTLTGGVTHTFIPGTVIPANGSMYITPNALTFRSRGTSPTGGEDLFVQGNYSGKISNFGELLELKDAGGNLINSITTPNDPSDVQRYLVISEIMYHPVNDDDEFLEVMNASDSVTLDLTDVSFTAGIDYTFPNGFMLSPGQRFVINFADFQNEKRLSNGSDRIKLEDASNSTVREFTYNKEDVSDSNNYPWPIIADGSGRSLVLIAPETVPDHSKSYNWRASLTDGGNPGTSDSTPYAGGDLFTYALGTPDPTDIFDFSSLGIVTVNLSQLFTADDVEIIIQSSTDLLNWDTADATLINSSYNGPVRDQTFTIVNGTIPQAFYRLKAVLR